MTDLNEPDSTIELVFDEASWVRLLVGHYDQNLTYLEQRLGVFTKVNGTDLMIKGPATHVDLARRILSTLYEDAKTGRLITIRDIDGVFDEMKHRKRQESSKSSVGTVSSSLLDDGHDNGGFDRFSIKKRGSVRARNKAQSVYVTTLKNSRLVFVEGPAGTGKTWLAVGHAVSLLERGLVERLILSRPVLAAGEQLGFLPGDMREKVDPYFRPMYDALHDFMDGRQIERALATGVIEVAPLAFMRGRTLSNAAILLDEAQNCTVVQMKMFLTRLGEGSFMVVGGDTSQSDLPHGQMSGLADAVSLLRGLDGVGHVIFQTEDVVRHELVQKILHAYDTRSVNAPSRYGHLG
jgi:phosphate starvation-inducible PhoH-like protein